MTSKARERHEFIGALQAANSDLDLRLAGRTSELENATKALKAAIDHITELEAEVARLTKLNRALATYVGDSSRAA